MVVFAKHRTRVAYELLAVQAGNERRMEPVQSDEFAEGRKLRRQSFQQLTQRFCLNLHLGSTRKPARNC